MGEEYKSLALPPVKISVLGAMGALTSCSCSCICLAISSSVIKLPLSECTDAALDDELVSVGTDW